MSNDFPPQDPNQTPPPSNPVGGTPLYNAAEQGFPQGGFPPPQQPKKSRWPMIIGIIIGVVVLLCACIGIGSFVAFRSAAPQIEEAISQLEATTTAAGTVADDAVATATSGTTADTGDSSAPQTITSDDGRVAVDVPAGWASSTELNSDADLQAENILLDEYIIVLIETPEDVGGLTVREYAEDNAAEITDGATDADVSELTDKTINGLSGFQQRIDMTVDSTPITYWVTTLEGDGVYYEILTWTRTDMVDDSGPVLDQVTESFREL